MTVFAWVSFYLSNVFVNLILPIVLPLFALWLVLGIILSVRGWLSCIS